jgi:low affinity Fe/Cu permease
MSLPSDRAAALEREQRTSLQRSRLFRGHIGSPGAIAFTLAGLAIWFVAGALTDWSRAWELVGSIGIPVLSLLVLIVLQHTQNHDDQALHVKLDEILRAIEGADDRIVAVENVDTEGLEELRSEYRRRSADPAERPLR